MLADSLGDYLRAQWRRIKSGESGALPVVAGLIIIIIFFQAERSRFGSAENLVNLFDQASIYILLGAAQIFALILSEIDLSVGFVLAVGGMVIAELIAPPVNFPWWLGIICGVGVTAGIGYLQGTLITRLHIPSFVVTLAGLLFFEGVLIELATIDKQAVGGVISVSTTSPVFKLVNANLSVAAGWIGLVVVIAIYAALSIRRAARRRAQGLSCAAAQHHAVPDRRRRGRRNPARLRVQREPRPADPAERGPVRGSVRRARAARVLHLPGRTRLGRYMYAIGGNPEAARRAGINVQRVRRLAFVFSAMTAGLAGLVYASTLGSVSTGVDGGTYTLYAVAAAVIGGASLFGGRGKPIHALLGGLVIGIVYNGLALMGISAAGQFIATAIVLLVGGGDRLAGPPAGLHRGLVAPFFPGPCGAGEIRPGSLRPITLVPAIP